MTKAEQEFLEAASAACAFLYGEVAKTALPDVAKRLELAIEDWKFEQAQDAAA